MLGRSSHRERLGWLTFPEEKASPIYQEALQRARQDPEILISFLKERRGLSWQDWLQAGGDEIFRLLNPRDSLYEQEFPDCLMEVRELTPEEQILKLAMPAEEGDL